MYRTLSADQLAEIERGTGRAKGFHEDKGFEAGYLAGVASEKREEIMWAKFYGLLDNAVRNHKASGGTTEATRDLWLAHSEIDKDLFAS